jgi:succinate dehydrogenase/fumarate reductase-like Fe-S protein
MTQWLNINPVNFDINTFYKNFDQAWVTLNEVTEKRGIDACHGCNNCTAKCVYHVNIARRIDKLKTMKLFI